ncbi:MAG: hypothetical protein HKN46_03935 [Acidimicrobiia bacterium]|nr:hypothetical protein [Acidimicrobiia bacterium]
MRRWTFLLVMVLVAAACSGEADQTTSTLPGTSAPTSTDIPSTTADVGTTTTTPSRELVVLTTGPKRLGVLPEGRHLDAGLDQFLDRVYDDYVGGLVFSLLGADQGIWHLPSGRQEPELLLDGAETEPFALFDVVDPPSRPPTALVHAGNELLLLPVTGGAPDELRIVDLAAAGSGSTFTSASIGGDQLLVTWVGSDGCATSDLFGFDGALVQAGLFTSCDGVTPVLSDEGDLIASVEVGASTRVVFRSPSDGTEIARWQVPDSEGWIHASGGVVAFPTIEGVTLISPDGSSEVVPEVGVLVGASIARSEPIVSDLASLGGLTPLATCSTADDRALDPQDGLTQAAAATRDAIAAAMSACDLSVLGSLLAPAALEDGDPSLEWWDAEAKGFPALTEVRALLALPFALSDSDDGVVFTWPAPAVGGEDADWDVLATVFNQEEIERWRSGGEPYDRLVIEITEDGTWLRASPNG